MVLFCLQYLVCYNGNKNDFEKYGPFNAAVETGS